MFRKLFFAGFFAAVVGIVAAPAHAAGHVRQYAPSRTATLHQASAAHKHHYTKLTKGKKGKGKHHGKNKKK
jgi:hypothetical protein